MYVSTIVITMTGQAFCPPGVIIITIANVLGITNIISFEAMA